MRKTNRWAVLVSITAAVALAGPPGAGHGSGGGGHFGSIPRGSFGAAAHFGASTALTGPAPLGASGPAPVHASGSFHPNYGRGNGNFYGSGNGNRGGRGSHQDNRRRYPYAFYYGPYAFPYYGYDNGYYDPGDYSAPGPEYDSGNGDTQDLLMSQDALGRQVQQLTAEVDSLKSQQQMQGAPPSMGAPARSPESQPQNSVPLTLVMRSGQQLSVSNYAITDGVFWNFSKQPAQKIPVSDIDLAASAKATEANGGEFPAIGQQTP
jgi:hypothetical protein